MFTLSTSLPDECWCARVLRNTRWKDSIITCPHCNSKNVKKEGHYRSYQKYFCKECIRWFNDKTGTIFHYSHTPLKIWFLVLYLFFVLWPGCSIREVSSEVSISYDICYRFIRTIMERLSSSIYDDVKLDDIIEADEFYVKAGLKGRLYHEQIRRIGRGPRLRGLKPWKGRGTFDKDHPMITCIYQRNRETTCFDVPIYRPLIDNICRNIEYGSTVYTDDYLPYNQLKRYGFVHEHVNHSHNEYARGDIHINNCECRSNLYKLWISKFMGVNKYNLQAYSKVFQFIHNNRIKTDNRKERFMKILCYK